MEGPECSICAEKFINIHNLKRHIDDLHTAVEGGVECTKDFCDLVFVTRQEMYIHRDKCIFTCPICGFVITRNGRAEGHSKKCKASKRIRDKLKDVIIHLNQ